MSRLVGDQWIRLGSIVTAATSRHDAALLENGDGPYTRGVRIPCLLALAAIGVAGIQAQPARESVVVILDSDGPVANAEASARLRALALARVERYGRPVYFDLTADAITPVPDSAGESFRSATFTFRPPIYAGVSELR